MSNEHYQISIIKLVKKIENNDLLRRIHLFIAILCGEGF